MIIRSNRLYYLAPIFLGLSIFSEGCNKSRTYDEKIQEVYHIESRLEKKSKEIDSNLEKTNKNLDSLSSRVKKLEDNVYSKTPTDTKKDTQVDSSKDYQEFKNSLGKRWENLSNDEKKRFDSVWKDKDGWRFLESISKDPNNYKKNLSKELMEEYDHFNIKKLTNEEKNKYNELIPIVNLKEPEEFDRLVIFSLKKFQDTLIKAIEKLKQ